ncbi:MAG: hypothetical protein Kow0037_08250 [Calditrichia bacterium]
MKMKRELPKLFSLLAVRGLEATRYKIPGDFEALGLPSLRELDFLYRHMKRYAVRLLLHQLLSAYPKGVSIGGLSRYGSHSSSKKFLEEAILHGIVEEKGTEFYSRLNGSIRIGDLLEWYVAELFFREMGLEVIYSAGLRGGGTGGDYDVLATDGARLVYLEIKSAPPKGIHVAAIKQFLKRTKSLLPDIAIFFNDTHLRMRDKIVLMFEEALVELGGIAVLKTLPVERVQEQIFHIGHYLYILNSRRNLLKNFQVVFRDYLAYTSIKNDIWELFVKGELNNDSKS